MPKKPTLVEQLRGATKLAVDATRNVTDLVEKMHHTIGGGPELLGKPLEQVTKLLTGPTYSTIRGVTKLVGAGLDLALGQLQPLLDQAGADRGMVLAALNGVMGDYLAETHNPLAIAMKLTHGGEPLELTNEALKAKFPEVAGRAAQSRVAPEVAGRAAQSGVAPEGNRLLVLVHGSSMDDLQWLRKGHDHGAALAKDRGFVPLSLRYNSGLHASSNGRQFAAMLEGLVKAWPRPVEEVVLLGHSMGGLVSRAACHVAEGEGHAWRKKLSTLITLGTPHHGSPLERGGNWFELLLGVSRYSAPLKKLGELRSAGVTDLRYGNVLDEHWQGKDRFAKEDDPRGELTLPAGVACYAIAGTVGPAGDGLVQVDSALGRHEDKARALDFPESHQWIATGTNHLDLLSSEAVYGKLLEWIAPRG